MVIFIYFFVGSVVGLFACMALSSLVSEYGEKHGLVKRNKGH